MAGTRKLESCIAYSLRHAKKAGWEEVADFLSSALFHATKCRNHRHPVRLYSALGLDMELHESLNGGKIDDHFSSQRGTAVDSASQQLLGTSVDSATQTVEEVFTNDECQRITEGLVEKLMKQTYATVQLLSDRLQTLEGNPPGLEATSSCHAVGAARDAEANSSRCIGAHLAQAVHQLPSSLSSRVSLATDDAHAVERLREEHILRRRAMKEQRRRARQQHND
ncbi:unnamed protein product [Symbiodinium sp. CCMP2456]|nr:unnamed protein product [Symbiodinium sp. CCMP2456]